MMCFFLLWRLFSVWIQDSDLNHMENDPPQAVNPSMNLIYWQTLSWCSANTYSLNKHHVHSLKTIYRTVYPAAVFICGGSGSVWLLMWLRCICWVPLRRWHIEHLDAHVSFPLRTNLKALHNAPGPFYKNTLHDWSPAFNYIIFTISGLHVGVQSHMHTWRCSRSCGRSLCCDCTDTREGLCSHQTHY